VGVSGIGVMHIIDTLDAGGAERVAVNLANLVPRERYRAYLCTTRRDGPLSELVAEDVGRLRLQRKRRFEVGALRRLVAFIRQHRIRILHAHDTSLFIAILASLVPPRPQVIWHVHFGRYVTENHLAWLYRRAVSCVNGVIAVNRPLVKWACEVLGMPAHRVWYIPNFVCASPLDAEPPPLPGLAGQRIVCVANLRFEKDHPTLVRAMAQVVHHIPTAHLLVIGAPSDLAYLDAIQGEIAKYGLEHHVSLLGQRDDVFAMLQACDIGVLSSASEGLPLALLEYGLAGLPAVATRVGQCPDVLDEGRAGILVPSGAPQQLAEALLSLLRSAELRAQLGDRLRTRVRELYSVDRIMEQVCQVYETVLSNGGGLRSE
jgi:glycosyltransferase involved in cell wall biosynthesis